MYSCAKNERRVERSWKAFQLLPLPEVGDATRNISVTQAFGLQGFLTAQEAAHTRHYHHFFTVNVSFVVQLWHLLYTSTTVVLLVSRSPEATIITACNRVAAESCLFLHFCRSANRLWCSEVVFELSHSETLKKRENTFWLLVSAEDRLLVCRLFHSWTAVRLRGLYCEYQIHSKNDNQNSTPETGCHDLHRPNKPKS